MGDLENRNILTALCKLNNLPPWERDFVRKLAATKTISPKQQARLYVMRDVFLGKEAAHDGFHGETMSPNRNPPDHV